MRQRLEYVGVVLARAVTGVMPYWVLWLCGTSVGYLFYACDRSHRRVALGNLAAAFPGRSATERRAIVRAMFAHFGRLREPLTSAASADAVLVDAGYQDAAERIGRALRVRNAYHITRSLLPPRMVDSGDTVVVPNDSMVFAFAGIARPERFFSDLTSAGWSVVGTKSFHDHHAFRAGDVSRIAAAAKKSGAAIVLTTDKDAVRLPVTASMNMPLAWVPLVSTVEPAGEFRAWLLGQIR